MKAILVLLGALAFALSPFVSPNFSGFDPNSYPVPQVDPEVQPAGWAFSIWGPIYLGLIIHAIFGAFQHKDDEAWDKGRISLFISLGVGTFWLPIAVVSPIWATVLIWIMLSSVVVSLYQIQNARPHWQASWPVAFYAGWLSAASFVSIGLLLAGYGVLSETSAAIVALILAAGFALYFQIQFRHWTYGASVAWGFFGIFVNNASDQYLVSVMAASAVVCILALAIYQFTRTLRLSKLGTR